MKDRWPPSTVESSPRAAAWLLAALLLLTTSACSLCADDAEGSADEDGGADAGASAADEGSAATRPPRSSASTKKEPSTGDRAAKAAEHVRRPDLRAARDSSSARSLPGRRPTLPTAAQPDKEGAARLGKEPGSASASASAPGSAPAPDAAKVDPASAPPEEMSFEPGAPDAAPGLGLKTLPLRDLVKTATTYRGVLRDGELPGIPASADYEAIRVHSGAAGRFGVGLQVWRIPNPGQQTRRFNDMLRQYPDTQRNRDLGDSSFRAAWGNLRYFGWLDRKNHLLAVVSCDDSVCKDEAQVLALARETSTRLPDLVKK